MSPLALTDAELARIVATARLLPRTLRAAFLEGVAGRLRAHDELTDALVIAAIAHVVVRLGAARAA